MFLRYRVVFPVFSITLLILLGCTPSPSIPAGESRIQIVDLNKLFNRFDIADGESRITKMYDQGLYRTSLVVVEKELVITDQQLPVSGFFVLKGDVKIQIGDGILPVNEKNFISFPPTPRITIRTDSMANLLLFQVPELRHIHTKR